MAANAPKSFPSDSFSSESKQRKDIKLSEIKKYFHLPIASAAKKFGICATLLKKICRTYDIKKWPYRKISSIVNSIKSLDIALKCNVLDVTKKENMAAQKKKLEDVLSGIIENPSYSLKELGYDCQSSDEEQEMNEPSFTNKIVKNSGKQLLESSAVKSGSDSVLAKSNKRKRTNMSAELDDSQPPVSITGSSKCEYVTEKSDGKMSVTFVGPVSLAPLVRRKQRTASKKLVPLIEPDICNYYRLDFVPKVIFNSSSSCEQMETYSDTYAQRNYSSAQPNLHHCNNNSRPMDNSTSIDNDQTGSCVSFPLDDQIYNYVNNIVSPHSSFSSPSNGAYQYFPVFSSSANSPPPHGYGESKSACSPLSKRSSKGRTCAMSLTSLGVPTTPKLHDDPSEFPCDWLSVPYDDEDDVDGVDECKQRCYYDKVLI